MNEEAPTSDGQGGFRDRVVWVTGAARGMGACFAARFAAHGARVGCIDVDEARLERVVGDLRAEGRTARAASVDVSDWASLSVEADALELALGPVNVVVANAGIAHAVTPVEQLDLATWEQVLAVDLTGVFLTVKAAIPQLRRSQGDAAIVMISSISGLRGAPGYAAYSAAKHGVLGLMKSLSNELAPDGIRVNAVCPSTVDTPLLEEEAATLGWTKQDAINRWSRHQLLQRVVSADEAADAVIWLASDAAKMITATVLPIDGGFLERWPQSVDA